MAAYLDAEVPQKDFAQGAGGDPRGGFTGAGPLENVAHVVVSVLDDACQIGVARPQARHRRRRIGHRLNVHLALPVGPVAVLDDHGDRPAHGPPVPHARDDLDAVVLDLLAPAAAIAFLAARQVDVDVLGQHRHASWQIFDEDRQLRSVRFAGRQHTQVTQAHGATCCFRRASS